MKIVSARALGDDPLAAAAEFYARVLPEVRGAIAAGDLPACVVFDPADHRHRAWRVAAVQALARAAVPGRINGVAAASEANCADTLAYLEVAAGITGQYFPLDETGAGDPMA